jgi:hypothetical protein
LAAWLHVLLLLTVPCLAQDKPACEVKVATLALLDGSDGLLHWRAGNTPTTPLQISTRYFSEGLKLPGNVIQFYKDPILDETPQDPPPVPLVTRQGPQFGHPEFYGDGGELPERAGLPLERQCPQLFPYRQAAG